MAHVSALLGEDLHNCRDSPASVISVDWSGEEADETEEAVSRWLAVKPNLWLVSVVEAPRQAKAA